MTGALHSIKPVGPGGSSIPGGKGLGRAINALAKALGLLKENPHRDLNQSRRELEKYYFENEDAQDTCLSCHSFP